MTDIDLGQLVRVHHKIKAKRAELSKEFKEADGALAGQQDRVRGELLEYLNSTGVESARTTEGTFYRSVKTRYWTSDWESMHKFIMENEVPEFLDKRLNQKNVREYLGENPDKVPMGLNVDSEYTLTVGTVRKK